MTRYFSVNSRSLIPLRISAMTSLALITRLTKFLPPVGVTLIHRPRQGGLAIGEILETVGLFRPLSSCAHLQDPDDLCKVIFGVLRRRSLTRCVSLSCHWEEQNPAFPGKAISGMRKLRLLLFARDDSICPARPNAYAFAQELILKASLELLDRARIGIRQYCVRHCLRNDAIQACLTQNRILNRNRTIWVPSQALQGQGQAWPAVEGRLVPPRRRAPS